MKVNSVEEVVELMGGGATMSYDLRIARMSIYHMIKSKNIPDKHWAKICSKTGLKIEDLFNLNEKNRQERKPRKDGKSSKVISINADNRSC